MSNLHPIFGDICKTLGVTPTPIADSQLLALVRSEASKFGRCCDQYQDCMGTFCCHECGQRTMAMLRGVQALLGIRKDGVPVDCAEETKAAHQGALLTNAGPELLEALEPFGDIDGEGDDDYPDETKVTVTFGRTTAYTLTLGNFRRARAAIAKATGTP